MAIGAMVKSALEIDEDTMIQFHVHREEKHKGAGSQKIFIWNLSLKKSEFYLNEIHKNDQLLNELLRFWATDFTLTFWTDQKWGQI